MAEDKKYYWFRLRKDFFSGHKIKMIEAMDNGSDYLVFYLKLLCESVSHEGRLRFSETMPYSEKMLSVITGTNIDIVKSAMRLFQELELLTIEDDSTIYMNEVVALMGCETAEAVKKRKYRQALKEAQEDKKGTMSRQCPIEIEYRERDRDRDKSNSKEITKEKSTRFIPPTLDDVKAYCELRGNSVDAEKFIDFYSSKGWYVGKNKMKDWKASVRTWERSDKAIPKQETTKGVYYDEEDLSAYDR